MGVYGYVTKQFINMSEVIKAHRFVPVRDNPSARAPHADRPMILTTRPQVTLARCPAVEKEHWGKACTSSLLHRTSPKSQSLSPAFLSTACLFSFLFPFSSLAVSPLAHLAPDSMTNAALDTPLPLGLVWIRREIAAEMFTLPISVGTWARSGWKRKTWSEERGGNGRGNLQQRLLRDTLPTIQEQQRDPEVRDGQCGKTWRSSKGLSHRAKNSQT